MNSRTDCSGVSPAIQGRNNRNCYEFLFLSTKKIPLQHRNITRLQGNRTTHQRVFIIEPDQLYYRTMTPADPCISARPAPEDRILQFFQSPFFLSVTIGIPFCTYKFIFGSLSIRNNTRGESPFFFLGWLIITWAALDLAMNVARAVLIFSDGPAQ